MAWKWMIQSYENFSNDDDSMLVKYGSELWLVEREIQNLVLKVGKKNPKLQANFESLKLIFC